MRSIRFKLKEKASYKHIYVDLDNRVHVLVPVMPTENNIGRDNTCAASIALNDFYRNIRGLLDQYIKDLQHDITLLPSIPIAWAKQERLEQLQHYQRLFGELRFHYIGHTYPRSILNMLAAPDANYGIMHLRPTTMDDQISLPLNITGTTFKLNRAYPQGVYNVDDDLGCFGARLNKSDLIDHLYHDRTAEVIIRRVTELYRKSTIESQQDFDQLLGFIRQAFAEVGYLHADTMQFAYTSKDAEENDITVDWTLTNLKAILLEDNPTLHQALSQVLNAQSIHWTHLVLETNRSVFDGIPGSLFDNAEREIYHPHVSIVVQFFFGVAALDYCEHRNIREDVGERIEGFSEDLQNQLIALIQTALGTALPEDGLLDILARTVDPLVNNPDYFQDPANRERIKTAFREQYLTIFGSPHYDDFFRFMPDKPGKFMLFRGNTCVHFGDYLENDGSLNYTNYYNTYFTDITPRLSSLDNASRSEFAYEMSQDATYVDADAQIGICSITDILQKAPGIIAKFLLENSVDCPNKKVFECLSEAERQQIKSDAKWASISNVLDVQQLDDTNRSKFGFYFSDKHNVTINAESERALYEKYGEGRSFHRLHGKNRKEKLHIILARTVFANQDPSIAPYQIMDGGNDQLVVAFTTQQNGRRQLLETALPGVLNNSRTRMFLTNDMAASLYTHANIADGTQFTTSNLITALQHALPGNQILDEANATTPNALIVTENSEEDDFIISCQDQTILGEARAAIAAIYQRYCHYTFSQQEVRWIIASARTINQIIPADASALTIKAALEELGIEYIGNFTIGADGQCDISIPSHSMRRVCQILLAEHLALLRSPLKTLESEYSTVVLKRAQSDPSINAKELQELINNALAQYTTKNLELESYFNSNVDLWERRNFTAQGVRTFYNSHKTAITNLATHIAQIEGRVAPLRPPAAVPRPIRVRAARIHLPPPLRFVFPPILKHILISTAVGLGCTALSMGIVAPSILGLTGEVVPFYAVIIGGVIFGIGEGILYACNEENIADGFGVFNLLGTVPHVCLTPILAACLWELTPYLASTGLAPEMVSGIWAGSIFFTITALDILLYTLLKHNEIQIFA